MVLFVFRLKTEHNERFEVSIATSIHQSFPWLYSSRAPCTIFQVPTVKITVGRRCTRPSIHFHCACSAHKHAKTHRRTDTQTHRHMTLTPCVSHSLSHIHMHIHIHVGATHFAHFSRKKRSLEHVGSMMCTVRSRWPSTMVECSHLN